MTRQKYSLIGGGSGWGATNRGTQDGPEALKTFSLEEKLHAHGIPAAWKTILHPSHQQEAFPELSSAQAYSHVIEFTSQLAESVCETLREKKFPIVFGGDHSQAIATWSATTTTLNCQENFGLIWIDAHMDAHVPETSPTQSCHGMPVACLMGYGRQELTQILEAHPKLNPKHFVLIGIRSYEAGEAQLLEDLNVRVIKMQEVKARGIEAVVKEALEIVSRDTQGFGLSIDLDGFDPLDAPGVGTPVPDGLRAEAVLPALKNIRDHPKFKALEIMEYNPHLDKDFKTADLVVNLCEVLLKGSRA